MIRVAALYLLLFVQFLDASIVSVGLSAIARSLQVEVVQSQWVVTAYGAGIVLAIPFAAKVLRGVQPRCVLTYSMLAFLLASWACAAAGSLQVLTVSRFIQGFSSGCVVLVGQRLLIEYLGEHQKAFALSLWTSAVSIAPVLGPFVGAVILEISDWRWMFYINMGLLPLCFLALRKDLTWRLQGSIAVDTGLLQLAVLSGVALFAQLLSAQLFGTEESRLLDLSDETLMLSLLAVVCIFLSIGQASGDHVFRWGLLKDVSFLLCTIVISLINAILMIVGILLPLWLQQVRDYSVFNVAYVFGASGLVSGLLSPFIGKLVKKEYFAVVAMVSITLMAASLLMASQWQIQTSYPTLVAMRLVQGLALALFAVVGPLGVARFRDADLNEANAMSLFIRMFASNIAIGLAIGYLDHLTRVLRSSAASSDWFSMNLLATGVSPASVLEIDKILQTMTLRVASGYAAVALIAMVVVMSAFYLLRWIPVLRSQRSH